MRIGQIIADYRFTNRKGIREQAAEIGISPATLSRIENGKSCDGESMAKLILWLISDPDPAAQGKRVKPTAKE